MSRARRAGRGAITVSALSLIAMAGGCASPWETTYAPTAATGARTPLAQGRTVRMQNVPWERIDAALQEFEAQRAASDAPVDEWPADKQAAAKADLLRALQVTTDPSRVEILGRSTFRTTTQTDPNDGELAEFARTVGADTVVWASSYLGKTQVVRDEPVSEWRSGSYSGHRRSSSTYTETSTIWVPVVVEQDEHAFIAYFLRIGQ